MKRRTDGGSDLRGRYNPRMESERTHTYVPYYDGKVFEKQQRYKRLSACAAKVNEYLNGQAAKGEYRSYTHQEIADAIHWDVETVSIVVKGGTGGYTLTPPPARPQE